MSKAVYVGAVSSALRDLPDGYTQVQYIESSGTQYIDTGFKPNQDTRVVVDGQYTTSDSPAFLFAARNLSPIDNAFNVLMTGSAFRSDYDAENASFPSMPVGARYTFDKNRNICTIGDKSVTNTAATFQSSHELYLFCSNDGGRADYFAHARIYSARIYDNDVLVRDFVPCRNSGGTVGLYDMAGAVFYSGSGSGAFTAGSTVAAGAVAHKVKALYVGVDGIARKVKKVYIGVDGKARLCYAADPFASYSGKYTVSDVEVDGKPCKLYTLTTSGTLVLIDEIQYWMCGGGASGASVCEVYNSYASAWKVNAGTGGGGGYIKTGTLNEGLHVVTIGAGGAKTGGNRNNVHSAGAPTKIGANTAAGATAGKLPYYDADKRMAYDLTGSDGYSGGGGTGYAYTDDGYEGITDTFGKGVGNASLAYPFGLASLKAHSAGGGAGGLYLYEPPAYVKGGNGGSQGSNGIGAYDNPNLPYELYGIGGVYGGGNGGNPYKETDEESTGRPATFYGGGGGGGSYYLDKRYTPSHSAEGGGGAGYQGVVYLLAPV